MIDDPQGILKEEKCHVKPAVVNKKKRQREKFARKVNEACCVPPHVMSRIKPTLEDRDKYMDPIHSACVRPVEIFNCDDDADNPITESKLKSTSAGDHHYLYLLLYQPDVVTLIFTKTLVCVRSNQKK